MEFEPIKIDSFKFKKSEILKNKLLIGFDQGCSLTKIVFVDKENQDELFNDNEDYVTFKAALFKNEDTEKALVWVKEKAYISADEDYSIHSTGVGGFKHKNLLENIFKRKTEMINEELSIAGGINLAMRYIGVEALRAPPVTVQSLGTFEGGMIEKFKEMLMKKGEGLNARDGVSEENVFPCICLVSGSAAGLTYFNPNGVASVVGGLIQGGKPFMGLAKCLLDTNDFNEITALADKGDRKNIDTVTKEVLENDPNSPYGRFPSNFPIFSFGKAMDYDIGKENVSKEDLAASLIGLKGGEILQDCSFGTTIKKMRKIYCMGNIFRSVGLQKEILKFQNSFPSLNEIVILNFGYFGALGAMLTKDNETKKYFNNFQKLV